jgi:uncharacterized membrane protein YfcA
VVGLAGAVGSVVASQIALGVEGRVLSAMFGVLAVGIAAQTLYRAFRQQSAAAS